MQLGMIRAVGAHFVAVEVEFVGADFLDLDSCEVEGVGADFLDLDSCEVEGVSSFECFVVDLPKIGIHNEIMMLCMSDYLYLVSF